MIEKVEKVEKVGVTNVVPALMMVLLECLPSSPLDMPVTFVIMTTLNKT